MDIETEWAATSATLAVEDAARVLGISRTTAYAEAARFRQTGGAAGLPNFRLGGRILVPKARLAALLNGDDTARSA